MRFNPAAYKHEPTLNEFTEYLKSLCTREPVKVKLVNDTTVEVMWDRPNEDNSNQGGFRTTDWNRYWNTDGTSITNPNFDILYIISE